jgi:hypothetical protein
MRRGLLRTRGQPQPAGGVQRDRRVKDHRRRADEAVGVPWRVSVQPPRSLNSAPEIVVGTAIWRRGGMRGFRPASP